MAILINKRHIVFIGLAILVLFALIPHTAAEAKEGAAAPTLYIDGKPAEYKQLKVNKRVENMISMNTATTKLNLKLKWVTKNKEWILSNAGHTIRMKLDSTTATVDSKQQKITTPAIVSNGTLYLPLRFIVVSGGGKFHNNADMPVFWVLSADQNALTSAIMRNNADEAKLLLKDWKDATIPLALDGTMPYNYAVHSVEMTELLLDKGFPVNYRDNEYANVVIRKGASTLLNQAASYGEIEVVKVLLDHGADPNLKDSDGSWNAVESAVWGRDQAGSELFALLGYDATVEDYDRIIELLQERMKQGEKQT
ncbi:ankyrin repeat domain-containing protein [Cohnella cholangitidis]|uniref:ankyrin repeat domain-containing protein n=1 Tax=Cohnella cholangitidis TaxID=2598458 RepID=UPI0015FC2843|nr:ankyrin repeat domain-containing protein [Cohnella cholangitidis]